MRTYAHCCMCCEHNINMQHHNHCVLASLLLPSVSHGITHLWAPSLLVNPRWTWMAGWMDRCRGSKVRRGRRVRGRWECSPKKLETIGKATLINVTWDNHRTCECASACEPSCSCFHTSHPLCLCDSAFLPLYRCLTTLLFVCAVQTFVSFFLSLSTYIIPFPFFCVCN